MSVTADSTTARGTHATMAVRLLVAVPLAISGYLHYDLASGDLFSDGKVTLAGLFVGQAVVAVLVALWLLVRGDRLSLLAAAAVGLGSLAALLLSTWVKVPSIGPLPAVYDPIWYTQKVIAAVAAGFGGLMALLPFGYARRS